MIGQYAPRVLSFVMHLLADRSEAEDVAQDVFVKAYQKIDLYHGKCSFLAWLLRIAYNESITHLRRRQPRTTSLDDLAAQSDLMRCSTADKDAATVNEERIRMLSKAMDRLNKDEQLLVHMFYYEGRSLNDIAYIMDAKPNTLSARLHRIREKLLIMIKQDEHEQNR